VRTFGRKCCPVVESAAETVEQINLGRWAVVLEIPGDTANCTAGSSSCTKSMEFLGPPDLLQNFWACADQTKQVSKETYYRGKRDLLYADFSELACRQVVRHAVRCVLPLVDAEDVLA
jgi:hypothetical protein